MKKKTFIYYEKNVWPREPYRMAYGGELYKSKIIETTMEGCNGDEKRKAYHNAILEMWMHNEVTIRRRLFDRFTGQPAEWIDVSLEDTLQKGLPYPWEIERCEWYAEEVWMVIS